MSKADTKYLGIQPVTATSNTTSTFVMDTAGFSRAVVDFKTSAPETTNLPAVLKLSESDDATTYTDIDEFTAGTGFTAVAQTTATTTTNAYRMDVDCRGRKRYLKLTHTPAVGQGATALTQTMSANLYRPARGAKNATEQGVSQVIFG
jgi:hypothetical protein